MVIADVITTFLSLSVSNTLSNNICLKQWYTHQLFTELVQIHVLLTVGLSRKNFLNVNIEILLKSLINYSNITVEKTVVKRRKSITSFYKKVIAMGFPLSLLNINNAFLLFSYHHFLLSLSCLKSLFTNKHFRVS